MLYGELPQRAYDLQNMLDKAYEQISKPGLSSGEMRELEKTITAMECELDKLLDNKPQAYTPGGYVTQSGVLPTTGSIVVDQAALILGDKNIEPKKKPWPWILIALAAAGATYATIKG